MHTALNAWRTLVLGSVAVVALAACRASDAPETTGPPAPSATVVPDTPSAASTSPSAVGGTTAPTTASTRPPAPVSPSTSWSSGSEGPGGSAKTTTACTDENVSVTAQAEPHDSLRHLTLTATNIGGTTCTLYKYALVRFDDGASDEVGPLESNWHAVATLAPGAKAYAGMRLFVAGQETRTVRTLTLGFQGRDSADEIGAPIDVPLPDGSPFLNIGPTPGVTFWDTDLASVRRFTFAR
ncbi:DUF4232 domain-containing protein [Streptomyces sp. NPDC014746]|uniref:DUF4232 domain-containing protein n=1 Tax=Streptomyces sp. NPDC014746 TaxID=3364904 RepID=UPI0036FE1D7B